MNIEKIFQYALAREYQGKRFFTEYADRLQSPEAISAFKIVAQEEQKHIEYIQAQLDALRQGSESEDIGLSFPQANFFSDQANTASIDQIVSESMVADLPVLRMAYLIERDFSELYNTWAQKTEGQPRQVLEMLARWEAGHERLFKHMHDQLFEKYADMPWGG